MERIKGLDWLSFYVVIGFEVFDLEKVYMRSESVLFSNTGVHMGIFHTRAVPLFSDCCRSNVYRPYILCILRKRISET